MIQYKTGDLLNSKDPFIAHGCNSYGIMGAGVALQIRERYPWVAEGFVPLIGSGGRELEMGALYEFPQKTAPYRILNLITQDSYGWGRRFVSYDAVDKAFIAVRAKIGDAAISVPRIGAGFGGGSWSIVEAIIEEHLRENIVTVWDLP
jgi:O-acetyl-ADP-ribose deacetylase (regulator of RNase III)